MSRVGFSFVFADTYDGYLLRPIYIKTKFPATPIKFDEGTSIRVSPHNDIALIGKVIVQLTKLDYTIVC